MIVFLTSITLMVYRSVGTYEFVALDDVIYVTANPLVNTGLSLENIRRTLTSTYAFNWHPLTWISHMVDVELFGLNPGAHHLSGLALHILNGVLLFLVLKSMTGAYWRSGLVAVIFAVHPMHVESVAWISERKDVLSTFFGLAALAAYLLWTRHRRRSAYLAALLLYVFSLMSKSMLVTFPVLLLIVDYWPLGRINRTAARLTLSGLLARSVEKIPFFCLSLIISLVTLSAQRSGGAAWTLTELPLRLRVPNVLLAYVKYLHMLMIPVNLTYYYPYNWQDAPIWKVVGASLILSAMTAVAVIQRKRPYLGTGWIWFVGLLAPVIGLVAQAGPQAIADRYTYFPSVGLFLIMAWGIGDLASMRRSLKPYLMAGTVIVLTIYLNAASVQVGYWRDSRSLAEHALKISPENELARLHLNGARSHERQRLMSNIAVLEQKLADDPGGRVRLELGLNLLRVGKFEDAARRLEEALRKDSANPRILHGMGLAAMGMGKAAEAEALLRKALDREPGNAELHGDLGGVLSTAGRWADAAGHFREALRLGGGKAEVYLGLGAAEAGLGKPEVAEWCFLKAIELRPELAEAHFKLGQILTDRQKIDEAITEYGRAVFYDPDHAEAHNNLGVLLGLRGKTEDALLHFNEALRVKPDFSGARLNLEMTMARGGKLRR